MKTPFSLHRLALTFASAVLVSTLPCAHAGTTVLDVELGVTTHDQVRSALIKKTKVTEGTSYYMKGPRLSTDGSSYGIDGLNSVQYAFDTDKRLAVVSMLMQKARFNDVFELLNAKYGLVSKTIPTVGDRYATFLGQDSVITIVADHLEFEMQVRYMRNDYYTTMLAKDREEEQSKHKREKSKF